MATDKLGREIKQGDLVVVKATGGNSSGLRVGVYYGSSVRFRGGDYGAYSEYYIIENPSQIEQDIKDSIIERLRLDGNMKQAKSIPKSELKVGGLYVAKNGSKSWYLGMGKITKEYSTDGGETWERGTCRNEYGEGYIVAELRRDVSMELEFEQMYFTKTRKTVPQFIEKLEECLEVEVGKKYILENDKNKKYRERIIIEL